MKPVVFQWDGDNLVPLKRFTKLCNDQYVVGETYTMAEIEDRSKVSHDHYFATLDDYWHNLPESQADQIYSRSPEHLRKYALIKCGYANILDHVCESKAEALRTAALIAPIDEYALIEVRGCVVRIARAQSQKMRAMGKKDFQESKSKVLDYVASLIDGKPAVPVVAPELVPA